MTTGLWILGDQLWPQQTAIARYADEASKPPVILIESLQHVQQRPYHCQKLILLWSAMRHFAQELRDQGWPVTYVEQAPDFQTALQQWLTDHDLTTLQVMTPTDRPFQAAIAAMDLPAAVEFLPNNLFLWTDSDFQDWAKNRKSLLLETFYREGRKRFDVLMTGADPIGDRWNFDQENRRPPKSGLDSPDPLWFEPDDLTQAVIQTVQAADYPTYGQAVPFRWGVTRDAALAVLDRFVTTRLETFGPYQDAMVTGEDTMWHGLISPYLNIGLLHPQEVIEAIETAFSDRQLPLNSVEGFIRQVLGWREYMRGLYSWVDDDYADRNFFAHDRPLPDFFWDSRKTDMNCLHQVLDQVERTGYAHHIQRLMILANFCLIAGFSPQMVKDWFHAAFIDAYDWVMQTNVLGMGLFADGGVLASKPYAASANYINKMSDYCQDCRYSRTKRIGQDACPFNYFYWDFLHRHRDALKSQGRMNLILANLKKMSDQELDEIHNLAIAWHQAQ